MLLHGLAILSALLGQASGQAPASPPAALHTHGDDFGSMVEHRAFQDLMLWKDRYPWRVGTEVRKFVLRLEKEREKADPEVDRVWNTHAAFLAEVLADDTYTPWLLAFLRSDVETRAQFETVRTALADIAASIPTRKKAEIASIIEEIDGLRAPIAPPWAFETCAGELIRIAGAAQDAGASEVAEPHAEEILAIAERTRDGETAVACAGLLGTGAHGRGDFRGAALRFGKAVEIAETLEELPERFESALDLAAASAEYMREHASRARVERLRARIATRRGDARSALDHWKRSVDAMERLRRGRATLQSWNPLPGNGPDPYFELTLAAARNGDVDEAWKSARRLRDRTVFQRNLMQDPSMSARPVPPKVAAARRELEQRQSEFRSEVLDQFRKGLKPVVNAERELDAVLLEEEARDPRAAVLLGFARGSRDPARIQEDLLASKLDAVVEYVVGETETVALTMDAKTRGAKVLPIGAAKIESMVGQLLAPIELFRRGETEPAKLRFDAKAARELHATLVEPILPSLGKRIAVVPDGALENLPFEALVSGGEEKPADPARPFAELSGLRFLIDDRAVVILASAEALAAASKEVITTRWTADDATIAVWTKSLQARFAAKDQVIDAVRAAKLEVRQSEDPRGFPRAHPWFWASWVVRRGD